MRTGRYTTTDLESMQGVLRTRAWKLLEEHFAELRSVVVDRVLDPTLDPNELAQMRGEEAGRREVIDFFRENLEDANLIPRTEEDE